MGHSRWRALRGYLIWSQERLRTAAARKPGTRQMISSTDLNPAEAAVCKSREDPTAVRHGRPGLPCAQLDCAACVKAHKRAAWGCARACFSIPIAARLLLVRGPPFRDPRSSSRPEGPNALDFVKQIGLVRPEMALDRAPRGLTRRCRRRFHFFVAPRSALGAFVFSAHGAPACSLLSGRVLSEMKRSSKPGKHCKSTCTTSTPGKRRGTPPAKSVAA